MNSAELIRTSLPNGLKILIKPIFNAPIISSWLWYDVGSRNEISGKTGLSHWVEHMQFKGTKRYSGSETEKAIARTGGYTNAFTSPDWTAYFQTLPSQALEMTLAFEASRMFEAQYEPEEVELERTVILSEREGNENDPQFLLGEQVQKAAFRKHPYRTEVLGEIEDLLRITRDDLFGHYRNYYQPSNATLCLAGAIEPAQAIALVGKAFGEIQTKLVNRQIPEPEDSLKQADLVEVHGPEDANFIQLAWRSPRAADPDFFAYTLIESILSGPSSLNMFGSGGIGNRTSLLYQQLVENQIAASVNGSLTATIDPATYSVYITCRPDHQPEEVLSALNETVDSLLQAKVNPSSLNRALKQARANFAYGSDNITNQAFWMGYSESFADYDWFCDYVDRLAQVSPEDVQRVAQKYLKPENRVVGIYRGQNA